MSTMSKWRYRRLTTVRIIRFIFCVTQIKRQHLSNGVDGWFLLCARGSVLKVKWNGVLESYNPGTINHCRLNTMLNTIWVVV